MKEFTYQGDKTKEISFPMGGIGTGCIGLAGNGRLVDWEIFNRPNKGSINGFSHFAIKAESDKKVLDARVLNGELNPPYTGVPGQTNFQGYGFGPSRESMAGVPHFREVQFRGEFPLARLNFKEDKFPGIVKMNAFNPFIPLNDKESSIPGAFFEIEVENTTEIEINYTIAFSVNNPLPAGTTINQYQKEDGIHTINLKSNKYEKKEKDYGELSIATDKDNVSYQEYWYRGSWFDNLEIFWREFSSYGKLNNRHYTDTENTTDVCTLDPGSTCQIITRQKEKG